jgi:hypothetical protein
MLLKFEHNSKDGSFYIAANYYGNTIYMEDTRHRNTNHNSPQADRDLRSHTATAGAAAALAHAYLVYKDVPAYADYAKTLLATAVRAWNWVTNSANPQNRSIDAANRNYTFNQADLDREMFWAAGALYRAVKASEGNAAPYEAYIENNFSSANVRECFNPGNSVNYNHHGKSFLGYVHYLYGNNDANSSVRSRLYQPRLRHMAEPLAGYQRLGDQLSCMGLLVGLKHYDSAELYDLSAGKPGACGTKPPARQHTQKYGGYGAPPAGD